MRCEEYDLCSYFKRVARKTSEGKQVRTVEHPLLNLLETNKCMVTKDREN